MAAAEATSRRAFAQALVELRARYLALAGDSSITRRHAASRSNHSCDRCLSFFDLDPRGPFATTADQVDGAFSFEGGDYLLSARWSKQPVGIEDLDAFKGKVRRRLENTLGLYVSVNGYAQTAVDSQSAAQPVLILMDGLDLMAVLDGRIESTTSYFGSDATPLKPGRYTSASRGS